MLLRAVPHRVSLAPLSWVRLRRQQIPVPGACEPASRVEPSAFDPWPTDCEQDQDEGTGRNNRQQDPPS